MTATIHSEKSYSLAEYLEMEIRSGERLAFYDGKIVAMPGGSLSHNRICRNLISTLDNLLQESDEFEVFGSDQKVYLPHFNYYLYPDAVVVTEEPTTTENEADALINPILIIEVASPSTAKYDRGDKFADYKSLDSFKEYVLVRQDRAEVNIFFREEEDLWRSTDIEGLSSDVHFKSIDIVLPLTAIYRKVSLPT